MTEPPPKAAPPKAAPPKAAPPKAAPPKAAPPKASPGVENVLILQGGGALGAYECGVYKVLADRLEALSIVAGASVGAINAGLIARNYGQPDRGVGALEDFWHSLAFPGWGWPEAGCLGYVASAQAALASVLFGNPRLFHPSLPWPGLGLDGWAPYTTRPMRDTMAETMGTYHKGGNPRLIVTAVEVGGGRQVAFDSDTEDITPDHIVASCSLPPGFPPTPIDGRHYWDGALWSDTPLPDALAGLADPPPGARQLFVIDASPRAWRGPQPSTPQGPSRPDGRMPAAMVRIQRAPLALDQFSMGIDFSARSIDRLIAEGENDASEVLESSGHRK